MAFVQWYVIHSHERRLPGSMIDDELEVCFELLLSVMLAKRRLYGAGYMPVPYPGGAKKKCEISNYCPKFCGGVCTEGTTSTTRQNPIHGVGAGLSASPISRGRQ
jgi:hypothetical protein